MDRRQFLASSGMAALAFAAEPVFAAGKASAGDTRLHGLLDAVFQDGIARSPEFATSLGVDKGKLAHLRSELSPATAAERHADLARNQNWLGKIKAVSDRGLSEAGKRHRALAIYQWNSAQSRQSGSISTRSSAPIRSSSRAGPISRSLIS